MSDVIKDLSLKVKFQVLEPVEMGNLVGTKRYRYEKIVEYSGDTSMGVAQLRDILASIITGSSLGVDVSIITVGGGGTGTAAAVSDVSFTAAQIPPKAHAHRGPDVKKRKSPTRKTKAVCDKCHRNFRALNFRQRFCKRADCSTVAESLTQAQHRSWHPKAVLEAGRGVVRGSVAAE